jgi:hypothetical protein
MNALAGCSRAGTFPNTSVFWPKNQQNGRKKASKNESLTVRNDVLGAQFPVRMIQMDEPNPA